MKILGFHLAENVWIIFFKMCLCVCRNIPVIRKKFEEVSRGGSLDGDKRLFVWV